MGENTDSSDTDEEGLDAAKEEVDEEPEPGLGPGADDEEGAHGESAETDENDT